MNRGEADPGALGHRSGVHDPRQRESKTCNSNLRLQFRTSQSSNMLMIASIVVALLCLVSLMSAGPLTVAACYTACNASHLLLGRGAHIRRLWTCRLVVVHHGRRCGGGGCLQRCAGRVHVGLHNVGRCTDAMKTRLIESGEEGLKEKILFKEQPRRSFKEQRSRERNHRETSRVSC